MEGKECSKLVPSKISGVTFDLAVSLKFPKYFLTLKVEIIV